MDLRHRLRAKTHAAHKTLDDSLGLLSEPLSKDRLRDLLGRFYGFYVAWEPMLRTHPMLEVVTRGRSKLPSLAHDLVALGLDRSAIERLPACPQARGLARNVDEALGSMYVVEGSTLGGQVISRVLQEVDWVPAGGIHYFIAYGARTGAMWREFLSHLEAASSLAADPLIETGAIATFRVLTDWLKAAEAEAAAD